MQISGLEICESEGLYFNDDWCGPCVRLRIESNCHARELRIGVWLPARDDEAIGSLFTITSPNRRPVVRALWFGSGMELGIPIRLSPGAGLAFQIGCENLVGNTGEDRRPLSFVMTSLVAM
jgi:hypothetical protein